MLSNTAVRRLRFAIKFMNAVPRKHFNMESWAYHGGEGFREHGIRRNTSLKEGDLLNCGTTACAAGWLAARRGARKAGVTLKSLDHVADLDSLALRRYLDIDANQFNALFIANTDSNVTPKQWARMAERLVKEWRAA